MIREASSLAEGEGSRVKGSQKINISRMIEETFTNLISTAKGAICMKMKAITGEVALREIIIIREIVITIKAIGETLLRSKLLKSKRSLILGLSKRNLLSQCQIKSQSLRDLHLEALHSGSRTFILRSRRISLR